MRSVPSETLQVLAGYAWPGNVRELQSAIQYAFVRATGEILAPHWLPDNIQPPSVESGPELLAASRSGALDLAQYVRQLVQSHTTDLYRRVHAEVDKILLAEILHHVQGNQVLASQLLGISRTTLRAKLGAFGTGNAEDTSAESGSERKEMGATES